MNEILDFVDVKSINIDHSYQRQLDVKRIKRLQKAYDNGACKAVSLSMREDGSLWVYDGQHTLALAVASGLKIVPAVIVKGDQKKEARWFLLMNGSGVAKATVRERHTASVTMGDEVANGVQCLLSKYNLTVAKGGTKAGQTSAIGSIRNWYRDNHKRLENVFCVIDDLWRDEDSAWTQVLMRGLWDIAQNDEMLKQVHMGLKKYKITPRRILDTAAGMQSATGVPGGGSGYSAIAIKQLSRTR